MKIRPRFFLARAFVALSFPLLGSVSAASQPDLSDPRFWPPFQMAGANRDLSPYTGLDRDGWIACGKHILEGAFHHVRSLHDPMFLPKMPGPGYPAKSNEAATPRERNNAIFEAISRTFNIAAPLIKNDPDITIRGIRLHDYYKYHLLELLTNPQSAYFIGIIKRVWLCFVIFCLKDINWLDPLAYGQTTPHRIPWGDPSRNQPGQLSPRFV